MTPPIKITKAQHNTILLALQMILKSAKLTPEQTDFITSMTILTIKSVLLHPEIRHSEIPLQENLSQYDSDIYFNP